MIKNKELLELIEKKKNEVSCENCIYCNLNAFQRGQWYCNKRSVFDFQLLTLRNVFREKRQNVRPIGVDCIAGVYNYSYILDGRIKEQAIFKNRSIYRHSEYGR